MDKINIYFSEDSELVDLETDMKGWRGDILIEKNNLFFMPEFITLERFTSDCNNQLKSKSYFLINSDVILIERIYKSCIIEIILKISNESNFFEKIINIDLKEKYKSAFQEYQELENWIKVY